MKLNSFHREVKQLLLSHGLPLVVGNLVFVAGATTKAYAWLRDKVPADLLFNTLDEAIGRCAADQGDVIVVAPGHTETAATQVVCDVADVSIIGLGVGVNRPTITAYAGAADCFSVTAAGVHLKNLKIVGATSCTALINLAGADFIAEGCVFQQAAAPLMGVTVAAGGHRFSFKDCLFYGLVDGPDCGIDIEAKVAGPSLVKDCIFNYCPSGLDLAGIRCNAFAVASLIVENCIFAGMETTAIDINSSDTDGGDGLIANCAIGAKGAVADIDTLIDAGGCILINNHGSDTAAEGGGLVPVTTPA